MEIEILGTDEAQKSCNAAAGIDKDIVIADTVIRKVDGKTEESKEDFFAVKTVKPDIELDEETEVCI